MISPIEQSGPTLQYLNRIGATIRSLFTASITTQVMGYEKDLGTVRFDRAGNVRGPAHLMPSPSEAAAIIESFIGMQFPHQQTVTALANSSLPDIIKDAPSSNLFIFRNKQGAIRFIQVRLELDNGDKRYVPQTYWSDGVWRKAEPEEGLPIYGIDLVEKGSRVFLHEGAKAAKAAQEIAKDNSHPWSEYFSTGVHVGWIGGAHHLHRTIWNELIGLPGELIIVPDNDFVGRMKVKDISRMFMCPIYFMQLDSDWPTAWDVADPIPEHFFSDETGLYVGPEFDELLYPCDWATEEVARTEAGRPIYSVREEFARNWVRIQNIRHYAHLERPELTLDKEQFNVKIMPFSDVVDTALLFSKVSGNLCDKVTFLPNRPTGLISVDGDLALNQYVDRRIRAIPSNGQNAKPFWEFIEYLLPVKIEREIVISWIATLYARPSVRMGYGLLLLSKMQGVGKSTLLNIIAELIGKRHVSFPGDAMIQSDFNGWIVNRRLVVVHEIYAGQNWKTYNRLKTLITDEFIEANNKHVTNYTLPNWTHYAAASNSLEALRMENDDRRWFVPKLPEELYFDYEGLRHWIRRGGLKYLAGELLDYGNYVKPGDTAPRTASKEALIDQSMPTDERLVLTMVERMDQKSCIDIKDIWLWLQTEAKSRAFVTPQRIASLLSDNGYAVDASAKIGSRMRSVVWKDATSKEKALEGLTGDAASKRIAERLQDPSQVFRTDATM